jgi:hypothetical protein
VLLIIVPSLSTILPNSNIFIQLYHAREAMSMPFWSNLQKNMPYRAPKIRTGGHISIVYAAFSAFLQAQNQPNF